MIKLTIGLFALTLFCLGCEKDEVAEVEVHATDSVGDAGMATHGVEKDPVVETQVPQVQE